MDFSASTVTEYNEQKFVDLAVHNQDIRQKNFNDCTFVNCSFRESVFTDCKFRNCVFKTSDLSLIKIPGCVFVQTKFQACQLIGVNWTEAIWSESGLFNPIDFKQCVISYSTFIGLNLQQVNLGRCLAKDVDFAEANLSQANCSHTDFAGSHFRNTNLSGVDFTGAKNYAISATLNELKGAKFSLPEAMALLYGLDIILTG